MSEGLRKQQVIGAANDSGGNSDASDHHHVRPSGLTKNEILVWESLNDRNGPLKAYEILDNLKEKGVRAPMTVYRALEGLEAKGLIHKLEGLNSFVMCNHAEPHKLQVFLVCEECPTVNEVDIDGLEAMLAPFAKEAGFSMETARLEVRGRCDVCV